MLSAARNYWNFEVDFRGYFFREVHRIRLIIRLLCTYETERQNLKEKKVLSYVENKGNEIA